jgi:endonuclease-3
MTTPDVSNQAAVIQVVVRTRITEICEKLLESFPNPMSELHYDSEYMFLVAVVLSAQTTDLQVNKVTSRLFEKYKTIDDIIGLGLDGLREQIKSIGLYKNKSKHIIELSLILKEKYGGKVPNRREDLQALPGVGRKTANVVLNTLFHESSIAVDTHVLRLSKRLGFSEGDGPLQVEQDLDRIIPLQYKGNISNLLVLHGRYVCKAQKPLCESCVLKNLCESKMPT